MSLQFDIYKPKAAMQMNFSEPKGYNKPGCIFIEMTSAKETKSEAGFRQYNWSKEDGIKIMFCLALKDIYELLHGLRTMGEGGKVSLVHDPKAGTAEKGNTVKTLQIKSPNGVSNGCLIQLSQKDEKGDRFHSVGLTGPETLCLATLLQAAIPAALGWQ